MNAKLAAQEYDGQQESSASQRFVGDSIPSSTADKVCDGATIVNAIGGFSVLKANGHIWSESFWCDMGMSRVYILPASAVTAT